MNINELQSPIEGDACVFCCSGLWETEVCIRCHRKPPRKQVSHMGESRIFKQNEKSGGAGRAWLPLNSWWSPSRKRTPFTLCRPDMKLRSWVTCNRGKNPSSISGGAGGKQIKLPSCLLRLMSFLSLELSLTRLDVHVPGICKGIFFMGGRQEKMTSPITSNAMIHLLRFPASPWHFLIKDSHIFSTCGIDRHSRQITRKTETWLSKFWALHILLKW